ncbi:MAG: beta-galactosidase [Bacteroides sp.]|jgi:hypothetical protein|nr:beta-galactosidase [Bacteroides sp.]
MKSNLESRLVCLIAVLMLLIVPGHVNAQQVHRFDVTKSFEKPLSGHFKMGDPDGRNADIVLNSRYLTIKGTPVLPVMGECHFSRIKPAHWKDVILKMKACGINIISTYVFWNRHEEIEGQFDWEGEKSLRAFVELCRDNGLFVFLRIGPWAHGEARNGGTPDWILRKKFIKDRSDDVVYQHYVERYFSQIASQVKGLFYKDGGNIIGIQLENEYWHAKAGEAHILWLKDTALKLGMDVPIYTVTGWGDGSVPPYQVIPLWGAYPDAPWAEHVNREFQFGNFQFDSFRDNEHIGNDQIKRKDVYMSYNDYPFFTCEMGVGIQNTYHRRLVISPIDGLGMITAKLGSGSNLLGYYVFSGGTQFRGMLHPTAEDQDETGYWTRVPAKSYDFQAAIRESGELSEAYKQVKKLHYFVDDFGPVLAPMSPVIGKAKEGELQTAVRSDGKSGFLFGIHYARYQVRSVSRNNRFLVRLKAETIEFPEKSVDIADSTIFIWPFNLEMKGAVLKYATAQLINTSGSDYFFFQNKRIPVEMAFAASGIERIDVPGQSWAKVEKKQDRFVVSDMKPGARCKVVLRLKDGSVRTIFVLTEEEADNYWSFMVDGHKECYITPAGMYAAKEGVFAYSDKPEIKISRLSPSGAFEDTLIQVPVVTPKVVLTPRSLLSGASWLESGNFKQIPARQQLFHRFFFKEFSLENPSAFRKVTFYLYPETAGRVSLNGHWVEQDLHPGRLNALDLTGYVTKGENKLLLAFPYEEGMHRFAGRICVEYMNYDRINILTDSSWLKTDMYSYPSPLKSFPRPVPAKLVETPDFADSLASDKFREWDVSIPLDVFKGVDETYLHLRYTGDRAELYNDYMLSDDDFNSNVPWHIGLGRQEYGVAGKTMRLVVYPLKPSEKIFFDVSPASGSSNQCTVKQFQVIPEYRVKVK